MYVSSLYRTVSHRITLYHIVSHCITPYHTVSHRIILYHIVSHRIALAAGSSAVEIIDKLNKAMTERGNVRKRPEGGLEGIPIARQLSNKGYKSRKKARTNGERDTL